MDAQVDDVAAGLEQVRDRGLGHEEVAVDVDAHHLAVLRLGHVGEVLGARDAGDVAEDVEPTELGDALVDRGPALVAARHVALARRHLAAGVGHELGRLRERVGVEVEAVDPGTLGREPLGDGPAHPRTGARDERDLSFEALLC